MRNFQLPGRSTAHGVNGMAAASTPLATLAAIDVLRRGGNAIDAAITASAVLCVVEPHMTGIGGDCFCLIGRADGSVTGLNGSGRAAMAADRDWLAGAGLEGGIPSDSPHAVTVPGAIDAWDVLLRDHGTIGLADALGPAIALARDGFAVTPRVARDWAGLVDKIDGDEGARRHLLLDGRAPQAGEIMRFPALARTLETIARDGRDAFYEGAIAEEIVTHLAARGGLLTMEDFARTAASYVTPIATGFADHAVDEIPPNGHGITALIGLNVLDRFDMARFAPDSPERYHLQTEAMRRAYMLRNRYVADPDHAEVPVQALLSAETADRLAGEIDLARTMPANPLELAPTGTDTIYLTVVDKDRTAVSFINSVFAGFGSGIVTPGTGIALQNRGCGFVTDPAHPNCIGPGKRPMHTIIPALVRRDGRVILSYGVMGGQYQPMGHVHVALNTLVYGMDVQEALDFPRSFHDDGALILEDGVPAATREALAAMGHTVKAADAPLGGGQAIAIDRARGTLVGGSDPRKDGMALGY